MTHREMCGLKKIPPLFTAQIFGGRLLPGDILRRTVHPHDTAAIIGDHRAFAVLNPDGFAGENHAIIEAKGLTIAQGLLHDPVNALTSSG
jgi:hypothetical protein